MLEHVESMDEESFYSYFAGGGGVDKTWSCQLSNARVVPLLRPGGEGGSSGLETPLLYEERLEYSKQVQETRLAEFDKQVSEYEDEV